MENKFEITKQQADESITGLINRKAPEEDQLNNKLLNMGAQL